MKSHTKTNNNSLTGYLTAAVTVGTLASTSHAAVVSLDISSISGPNGNLVSGPRGGKLATSFSALSPALTGEFDMVIDYRGYWSFGVYGGPVLATNADDVDASPRNFSYGSLIDSSANFEDRRRFVAFKMPFGTAPDFGPDSYMGFRSANGYYGYLEVTWESATNTFEVLSGAYEDQVGVGILAGAAAVPEPSTAMLSLGALAAGACIRRRKQAA